MEKRLIAAIALSILVIVSFQFLSPRPKQTNVIAPQAAAQRVASPSGADTIFPDEHISVPGQEEKETILETDRFILTFTNIGGALKEVQLKEYNEKGTDLPLKIVSQANGEKAVFALESNVLIESLDERTFALTERTAKRIVYAYTLPGRFTVIKRYDLYNSNDYMELRVAIQNLGNTQIYKDYDIVGASGLQASALSMGRKFLEIDSMIDGKLVKSGRVKGGEELVKGIVSWTGVKERYFCAILKPLQDSEGVLIRQFASKNFASGIRAKRVPIYPNTVAEDAYILYVGPNDAKRLSKLGFGFEQIINYGVFGGISKFLLGILRVFHKITRNWGVAIILLTCLINLTLFPLTRKSFTSMKKIQEVQPHIEKMRKLHKDNPQKLNKELAEVYRQYNINPLGGCLPLLIQMPIFIALYQGLIRSIELKGAHFLWIKDLSNPDFVSLPFSLPLIGNQVHILPLLMVVAMFFQQKLSSKSSPGMSSEQQQQQKIMLIFFPLFFGFLFYKFPSGLVLYWLTNTILTSIEHFSMRKGPATT